MNTTRTTLKNQWYRINLNRRILTYRSFFIYIRVLFNRWYIVVLCTVNTSCEKFGLNMPILYVHECVIV
jgi:hypothetical protein